MYMYIYVCMHVCTCLMYIDRPLFATNFSELLHMSPTLEFQDMNVGFRARGEVGLSPPAALNPKP